MSVPLLDDVDIDGDADDDGGDVGVDDDVDGDDGVDGGGLDCPVPWQEEAWHSAAPLTLFAQVSLHLRLKSMPPWWELEALNKTTTLLV